VKPHKLQMVAVTKDYPSKRGALRAVEDIDLHVEEGELVCLVGASGCGKSTLLSIAAGLQEPTEGSVLVDGHHVTGPGPDRGLVPQTYSLYPWRTVASNVAFGLELKGLGKAETRERVTHLLDVMGLAAFAGSLPRQLSGGMRQRVAIARAMATEPSVLLFDEPFGALDSQTRGSMREFVLQVKRDTGATILMVTHDVEEAVYLSSRVYVLTSRPGRVATELAIPFGDDRGRPLLRERAFQELCWSIDDLLAEQHGVTASASAASAAPAASATTVAG
jgi:NitT/TauT family transport system ATP-binding protein